MLGMRPLPLSLAARMRGQPSLRISSADAAHRLLRPHFLGLDREHLWRIDVNARRGLLGAELVSIGTFDATLADPRAIFKGALGASGIFLVHNHPSGGLAPSAEDLAAARRLDVCGLLLGIAVIDHLIVYEDRFSSLREIE